jgi:hypothetical protein
MATTKSQDLDAGYGVVMTLEFSDAGIAEVDAGLQALRVAADDAVRRYDWAYLRAHTGELRDADPERWADSWAPSCAIAARQLGEPDARALLDEAIAGGYNQPDVHSPELADTFGADPDWPELIDRIEHNVAPVPLAFLDWPTIPPSDPLSLLRLGSTGEEELRRRLPPASASAWETAVTLLDWVSKRWEHANAHMEIDDAVACLDRVDAGERFACVEYSLVLSQALNAVGIPSRRLRLRQAGYHAGVGRGHVVSEAWIDDLERWVVLDGQNGLYWASPDGTPVGALELQAASATPVYAPGVEALPADSVDFWFSYFGHVGTDDATWSDGPFVPVFQRTSLVSTPLLLRDGRYSHPDLSRIAIGVELAGRECAIRLSTEHPYATGFVVQPAAVELSRDSPVWTLDTSPGEHVVELAVRTPFGTGRSHPFRYVVSS